MPKKFTPTRGPLKGRHYKNVNNYRIALAKEQRRDRQDRKLFKEERYNQLLQEGIENKGVPNKKSLRRFNELYNKAKNKGFDKCPPVTNFQGVVINDENAAPLAYLLDYMGTRPIVEFGWYCIGDTPEYEKHK